MECDLRSEYQVDILDIWRKRSGLTVRRLLCYIKGLPQESRLRRAMVGPAADYDRKEYLLLEALDLLNRISYFSSVSATLPIGKKGDKKKVIKGAPERIPRPGDKEREEEERKKVQFAKSSDLAQFQQLLRGKRAM